MIDILRNLALFGGIGFMYHTNSIFDEYNREFTQILREYFLVLYNYFYDYYVKVATDCEQCYLQLEDVKDKLSASKNNSRFNQSDMLEIASICKTLQGNFDDLVEANKDNVTRGSSFDNKIGDILARYQKSTFVYKIKYTLFAVVEGGILFDTVFKSILSSVSCSLLVQLAMYCSSYDKKSVEMILNKLQVRMADMNTKMLGYKDKMEFVIIDCTRYQESANSNVLRSLASGTRVIVQTAKMIDETSELQSKLQELMNEARRNATVINRIIISESTENYLALSGILNQ